MDRLHTLSNVVISCVVSLVVPLSVGCDETSDDSKKAASSRSRVNAVAAKKDEAAPAPKEFCDVYAEGDAAKPFHFPELEGAPPAASSGWRWVNIWATWCKPCVEELPRLAKWESELGEQGLGDLVLVSADETAEAVATFRTEHPDAPESHRVADTAALKEWITQLGLDAGAPLPIHIFVDEAGYVRCLRAGGVGDSDRAAVEKILGT